MWITRIDPKHSDDHYSKLLATIIWLIMLWKFMKIRSKIHNYFLWAGEEGTSVAWRYKSIPRPCPGPGCLSPLLARPAWRLRPSPCPDACMSCTVSQQPKGQDDLLAIAMLNCPEIQWMTIASADHIIWVSHEKYSTTFRQIFRIVSPNEDV